MVVQGQEFTLEPVAVTPTSYPSRSASPSLSRPPSNYPTRSALPSLQPSKSPTNYPTLSKSPSLEPSIQPTTFPTSSKAPSSLPSTSLAPSIIPSQRPTPLPSFSPSQNPSQIPSLQPTIFPTHSSQPSHVPSISPTTTFEPSNRPSTVPTTSQAPSHEPSLAPSVSDRPSSQPSVSFMPTVSLLPSWIPSTLPSSLPSLSSQPSLAPSISHSPTVSEQPSDQPSTVPSEVPSGIPTMSPYPSSTPSISPSGAPSTVPSAEPSSIPSQAPTLSLMMESRAVGMIITGLDRRRPLDIAREQFQILIDNHTLQFWSPDSGNNWGTVVYNSTTLYQTARKNVDPLWRLQQIEFWGITAFPTTAPAPSVLLAPPSNLVRQPRLRKEGDSTYDTRQFEFAIIGGNNTNNDNNYNDKNSTISGVTGNESTTLLPLDGNETSSMPTGYPTISPIPTVAPSFVPSTPPTITSAPSHYPTATFAPSSSPTTLPDVQTHQIWYEQTIVYGERFQPFNDTPGATNDPRTTTIDQIFQFPFMLDQTSFTEKLIELINNQLPLKIEFVEVRETGISIAPTQYVSTSPSFAPTSLPSMAPSPVPSPPPPSTVGTTAIVLAVSIPVIVVLLIAFAGVIYITRVDHEELLQRQEESLSFAPDDAPVSPTSAAVDPNTMTMAAAGQGGPGGDPGNGLGAIGTAMMGGGIGGGGGMVTEEVSYGTPAAEPLIDASELLQVTQQRPRAMTEGSEFSGSGEDQPRHMSAGGFLPSLSAGPNIRVPLPATAAVGGYAPPTDSFFPTITPMVTMPDLPNTPGRTGGGNIIRASTTGDLPSSFTSVTSTGRLSPFQTIRGDRIPTIPTSQLGSSELLSSVQSQASAGIPAIASVGIPAIGSIGVGAGGVISVAPMPSMMMMGGDGGGGGPDDSTGLAVLPGIDTTMIAPSESQDMESDDPFAMTAFNLQISDIDDLQ